MLKFNAMKRLRVCNCKIGMRVVLTHPGLKYIIGKKNPLTRTKFECEGEIVEIQDAFVWVRWDNGLENGYAELELSSVTHAYTSIWDTMVVY